MRFCRSTGLSISWHARKKTLTVQPLPSITSLESAKNLADTWPAATRVLSRSRERTLGTRLGAALNKGKWRQISSGDTQNNKTQPLKRPNRNHQYTDETTKTRRLKQAKPPKQAKTLNRWRQAWLNYRMQGHSLPYYWITKAAIVICLVQQNECAGPEFYMIAPQAS